MPTPTSPTSPTLSYAFEIRAEIATPLHIGHGTGEHTEFTPITGGTVRGPRLTGTVLSGGGDWSSTRGEVCQLEARYLLRADDGAVIDIVNRGYYHESHPDPAGSGAPDVYFRTAPVFRTDAPAHLWLTRTVFVGLAHDDGDAIVIRCYSLG
ncbi:DUF3237 family protein [Streptomyces sp. SID8379]|uniref:DUF3237 domain-containing protein n=1 Tax=unclassified Streptomyces TaxID=2593676 RepID=UPI00036B9D50|nr:MULTISPECIES: DUF3237 domain-containing protein [unclassified Streptomyces]MYW67343.1 DUF3237 family protein [Streptomyces sp. SID8379]